MESDCPLFFLAFSSSSPFLIHKSHVSVLFCSDNATGYKGFKYLTAAVEFVKDIPSLAAECANVVLNFCYSKENVEHFLGCNGVSLLAEYLHSEDIQVQVSFGSQ